MIVADELAEWLSAALAEADDRAAALDEAFQRLENAKVLNRVVVHRYVCRAGGCQLAVVIRVGDEVLVRTRDVKYGKSKNLERSVESARRKRTLDGDRHWPGHTFDVRDLAKSGMERFEVNCRCKVRPPIDPREVLRVVANVRPGKPGPPTLL